MKVPDVVLNLAEKYGYVKPRCLGEWRGYAVYSAEFPRINGGVPATGLPKFILYDDGKAKFSNPMDGFAIMDEVK